MKFRYFDHTADVMCETYGKDINEAFENAGLAMFNILTKIIEVKPLQKISFTIKADKLEKLLYDFLDELLFYLDTDLLLFSKIDVKITGKYELKCTAYGDKASNYETHGDIKSPTYNEMKISIADSVTLRFVVDI